MRANLYYDEWRAKPGTAIASNYGGPPAVALNVYLFPYGEQLWLVRSKYCVNFGSGFLVADLNYKPWRNN